jgi:RecA DNA recombination protein
MRSAAVQQLESLLQAKKLDRAVARAGDHEGDVAPTGIASLDAALGGGWRRGDVSEIVGRRSSGRTSLLVATLTAATARGELVGLVDPFDQFDPITAAAAGLDLDRVLWVRGTALIGGARAADVRRSPFDVQRSFRSNPFARARLIEEAVSRGVRALDLIVRAGGFGVAALDLIGVPARVVRTLPFTTWLRLAHANEGHQTVCLLAADAPVGRSARGATLELDAASRWTGSSRQERRFAGFDIRARVAHARLGAGSEPSWVLRAVC